MKQHHNFKELKIWQKAKQLVLLTYRQTANLPEEEKFGLVQQMRRAAVSIPSNIAEGAGRRSSKDFSRFIDIATGSLFELETQYIICYDLDFFVEDSELTNLFSELKRMIYALNERISKSEV